jgi:uncharacterized protein
MKIYLREITDQATDLAFTQEDQWALNSVERLDERSDERSVVTPIRSRSPRQVSAHFNLRKVDDVVVISGKISAPIELVCSRCAAPFKFNAQPSFSSLFCKDPVMAGIAHLQEGGKPSGQNAGHARHAHEVRPEGRSEHMESRDLDITYLSEDFIDLRDVLTEQLQLQLPFQPLCKDDCQGMCSQCGADLNAGRCACAKLTSEHPFSVLRDHKIN